MALELLKKYREGSLWKRLMAIRPFTFAESLVPLDYALESFELSGSFRPIRTIHHYTGVEGLLGILQSNKLFATAAYYLNDSSEVEYGSHLVLKILEEWLEVNEKNTAFPATVLRALYALFRLPDLPSYRSETIYVACFCSRENLLSQWRAYGQKGGYSLGFRVSGNSVDLEGPPGFENVRLARVEYNPASQSSVLGEIIRETIVAVADLVKPGPFETEKDLRYKIVEWLDDRLLQEIVTFKHPAFYDEQEWRVIVRPNKTPNDDSVKFRPLRGGLVPYVELSPRSSKLPIASIYFGPSLEPNRTKRPLELLLRANGFGELPVKGADIPVIL